MHGLVKMYVMRWSICWVGITMGTSCALQVANLFLFYYERDLMMSLSDDKQADIIDTFNTAFRYLGDI